jgi:hypothetical protein
VRPIKQRLDLRNGEAACLARMQRIIFRAIVAGQAALSGVANGAKPQCALR